MTNLDVTPDSVTSAAVEAAAVPDANKRFWNNPRWVALTPILTTILLDGGRISHLWRMWSQKTAAGQSLLGWVMVLAALVLWGNFYRVVTPQAMWARRSIVFGVFLSFIGIGTILHFSH